MYHRNPKDIMGKKLKVGCIIRWTKICLRFYRKQIVLSLGRKEMWCKLEQNKVELALIEEICE